MSNIDHVFSSDGYYSCGASMKQYEESKNTNNLGAHVMHVKSHNNVKRTHDKSNNKSIDNSMQLQKDEKKNKNNRIYECDRVDMMGDDMVINEMIERHVSQLLLGYRYK
jgi:hypothetical protein